MKKTTTKPNKRTRKNPETIIMNPLDEHEKEKQIKNQYKTIQIISIKNNTDEKLYNVDIFNRDFEKNDKISYKSLVSGISYTDILLYKDNFQNQKIKSLRLKPFHEYYKYQQKQLDAPIKIIQCNPNGDRHSTPENFYLDPYQQQSNIATRNVDFIYNTGTQIQMEYLMPEAEVILYIISEESK